jgi:hypothetical protein
MKHQFRFALIVAALALAILACSSEAGVSSGGVLFQDDFSNSSSGWDRIRDSDMITDYENGGYRIQVLVDKKYVWANPKNLSFTDVHIEVDATQLGGPDDNDFGLICRYKDEKNFYTFIISSDGYYGIIKVKDGTQSLIGQNSLQTSDKINLGKALNHIRADCAGSTLTLYINGTQLTSQQDNDFASGNVGLLASAYSSSPGTDILFDNFSVTKP